ADVGEVRVVVVKSDDFGAQRTGRETSAGFVVRSELRLDVLRRARRRRAEAAVGASEHAEVSGEGVVGAEPREHDAGEATLALLVDAIARRAAEHLEPHPGRERQAIVGHRVNRVARGRLRGRAVGGGDLARAPLRDELAAADEEPVLAVTPFDAILVQTQTVLDAMSERPGRRVPTHPRLHALRDEVALVRPDTEHLPGRARV